jgi:hypothetical protein
MRIRSAIVLAAAVVAWGCGAGVPRPSTSADAAPAALLARAEAAVGAAAAREQASVFQARHLGTSYANEQAADPAQPLAEVGRDYRWAFDAPAGRMIREAEQVFPGAIRFLTLAALTPEGGWSADLLRWRTGTDLSVFGPEDAARATAQFERFFPHLLLRQARGAGGGIEPGVNAHLPLRRSGGRDDRGGARPRERAAAAIGSPGRRAGADRNLLSGL